MISSDLKINTVEYEFSDFVIIRVIMRIVISPNFRVISFDGGN